MDGGACLCAGVVCLGVLVAAENYGPAWSTRIDNSSAKQLLVLLANECGVSGNGTPRYELLVARSELKPRTVRRLLQVFETIGLIRRYEGINHLGKKAPAIQLNMQMLGSDIRETFDAAYKAASGKCSVSETAQDEDETVSETVAVVSETAQTVSETEPPHPLKGSPVSFPFISPFAGADDGGVELDPGQLEHLERCRPEDRRQWEIYYCESNRKVIEEAEACSRREAANREREAQLRRKMPTLAAAVAWVYAECRFVRVRGHDGFAHLLQEALLQDAGAAREYWRSAAKMAAAWKAYMSATLRWRYGPEKFIATGAWLDEQAWPWDEKKRL
jgi:hypothetical protein